MKPVLIYGSGIFGQVVRALSADCGKPFAGFVDDSAQGQDIVGGIDVLLAKSVPDECEVALAIGYNHLDARLALFERLKAAGCRFATLIHPSAYVSRSASIGEGAMVMAGAIVDTAAAVGELVVLWPGVIVNHESEIGRNTFISPGAILCGRTQIGSSCFIGAGAVITDHVRVANSSFVKAATRYAGGKLPLWRAPK